MWRRTSSLLRSRSFSSSTPRYENVRNVRFFLSSAANAGSVTLESAYENNESISPPPIPGFLHSDIPWSVVEEGGDEVWAEYEFRALP